MTQITKDTPVTLWWIADNQEEADRWKQGCNQHGDFKIELDPHNDESDRINFLLTTTIERALSVYHYKNDISSLAEYFEGEYNYLEVKDEPGKIASSLQ